MSNITIEWLSDECDCPGSSYDGARADGANVFIDDVLVLELIPKADCYNNVYYSAYTVYEKILEHLGHTIEHEASLVFFYRNDKYAIIAASRCGHTNMYHYHGIEPYTNTDALAKNDTLWSQHHNPIAVIRNPLDRVRSAMLHTAFNFDGKQFDYDKQTMFFYGHCYPYLSDIAGVNFRIIDFYDLNKYIPRRDDVVQSSVTDSHAEQKLTAEDVYILNEYFSLQKLQQEFDLYTEIMATRERLPIEEWKELTK